ncbi:hypothetical protein [Lysobacter sp. TAB13]|uniref:hypothetical protein n=1 Tax=Lysobacter sp. TAB13 TaxID=3233065 RepID=UPI003F971113
MFKKNFKAVVIGALMVGFCASADAALVRTVRYNGAAIPTGVPQTREVVAWCLPDEIATGGGFESGYGIVARIDDNMPTSNETAQGWKARFFAHLMYDRDMPVKWIGYTYVVCVKQS